MEKMPVGYRFHPTDEELSGHYLHNRSLMGMNFRSPLIPDYPDFYSKEEPCVVWEKHRGSDIKDDESLYFFTKRNKLSPKSSRFDRKVGSGTWSGQSSRAVIADTVRGVKRDFRYEGGSDAEQNNAWLMHEYELSNTAWVICALKKNPRKLPPTESKTNEKKNRKNMDEVPDQEEQLNTTSTADGVPKVEETNYYEDQGYVEVHNVYPVFRPELYRGPYPELFQYIETHWSSLKDIIPLSYRQLSVPSVPFEDFDPSILELQGVDRQK